jgi:CheY-like chemotaxis protein
MRQVYFYEDKEPERLCLGPWLRKELDLEVAAVEILPTFREWLEEVGDDLPELLILDLFTGRTKEPTCQFIRALRAEAKTRHLPVAVLTRAKETVEGASILEEVGADEYLCKSKLLKTVGLQKRILKEGGAFAAACLRVLLSRSNESREQAAIQSFLQRETPATFAIFANREPWPLLHASADALRFLQDQYQSDLQEPVPSALLPLLKSFGATSVPIPCNSSREVMAQAIRSDNLVVVTFRDKVSAAYIRALGATAFRKFFAADYRDTMVNDLIERGIFGPAVGAETVERTLDSIIGYYFALAQTPQVNLNMLNNATIRTKAEAWQAANLKNFDKALASPPTVHKTAAIHKGLKMDFHNLRDAGNMARDMMKLQNEYPLVESSPR